MLSRSSLRLCSLLACFGLALGTFALHAQDNDQRGRKYKEPPPAARIEITVVRATDGKPVMHAAVIFHPIEGDRDKGTMEVKTNEEGKAMIDVIPIGDTVRMQVIARGYQTTGEDYKVDKPEIAKEIRLKRPAAQYSIYNDKKSDGDKPKDNGSQPQK